MGLTTPQLGLFQAGMGAIQAGMGIWGQQRLQREADRAIQAIPQYAKSQAISNVYQGAKMRSTTGLSGSAKKLATSGVESATAAAMRATQDKKGGLGLITGIQAQKDTAATELATREEAAMQRNQASLTQAAGMEAAEDKAVYQSAKEKAELRANAAAQKVAAKKQMLSQGLAAMAGGASTAASGNNSSSQAAAIKAFLGGQ
jgi:hypothetical protein